jgi:hypothetical protein
MTPQHMTALKLANEVRVARADLKRRVRTNETDRRRRRPHEPAGGAEHDRRDLLACQRGWGPEKVTRFLKTFSMSEARTVGSLVERERQGVASRLHGGLRACVTLRRSSARNGGRRHGGRGVTNPAALRLEQPLEIDDARRASRRLAELRREAEDSHER